MSRWLLRLRVRWGRLRRRPVILAVCLAAAGLLALGLWMVLRGGGWGFPEKTLWDLFGLLIIPLVLGAGAWLFNRADSDNALDRQREAALTTYLDRMSELMLSHDLRGPDRESEARTVAVARTVSVLRSLKGPRIAQVIGFLTAAGLGGTKLLFQIDLQSYDLGGEDLVEADLEGADLQGANLRGVMLVEGHLQAALLAGADLRWAYLMGADLRWAHLGRADLGGAHLDDADLTGAIVTPEQLAACSSLENATMPDGQRYEDWMASGGPDWPKDSTGAPEDRWGCRG